MAKAKSKGKGKARKAKKKVSTAKTVKERVNVFEDTSYLDSIVNMDGMEIDRDKFLTERQRQAYVENMAVIDSTMKKRLSRFVLGFECQLDKDGKPAELDKDDMAIFQAGFHKMVRQEVNEFVKPSPTVYDIDKLGITEDELLSIVDSLERIHGLSFAEAIEYLERWEHNLQRSKNVIRSLQGFLLGNVTAYNRKNLHSSKTWKPVLDMVV